MMCVLCLHLLGTPASGQGGTIVDIQVEGNHNVSVQKILRVLRVKTGDPYDVQRISEALKRLHATKEFADVQAHVEDRDGGVALIVVVKEYTRADEIKIEGNKHIDDDDIKEAITIKDGSFVRPALLRKDFRVIEDLYKDKGYYRIQVTNKLITHKDKDSDRVRNTLQFNIVEGEKIKIKHIDFFGNRTLSSDELRKVMKSKQDGWFSGGEFKPKQLELDYARIDSLYRDHGFLDAAIIDKELIFSDDGKGVDVFITLRENTQYRVGRIRWTGNQVFPDRTIATAIRMENGEVFNDTKFRDTQFAMNEIYWDRGYIYNSISPEKRIRGDVIDLKFEIAEGKPARVNEINIAGNTKTHEKVIRRELMINPGDVFLRPRLIRSLREVFNLGFFAGPPNPQVTPIDDGNINITLNVEEKQTGQFRLGAGFSQLNSISGFIGLAETNFRGKGQTVSIDWEFARTRQNIDLRFVEPWLFGTPTNFSINVFNRVQQRVSQQFYDDRRRGISVRLGRPFPWFDYTSIFGRYSWEEVELSNFSTFYQGPLLTTQWPQSTSSLALTLVRNSTDNPFRPTLGTRSSITAEFNGGFLGGDVRFQQYLYGVSWYSKLFWQVAGEVRYSGGLLADFGQGSSVPDYELFRLGGNRLYGVRGYDFYEIYPTGNPPFLGGRFFQILSYQVTIPVSQTIYGLVFFDSGNTWNSFSEADIFFLKKGVGFGIRMELPALGTVGFDYGYGFDGPFGPGWQPHLSLGTQF